MLKINEKTIIAALDVLDVQQRYCAKSDIMTTDDKVQAAYHRGMKVMLEFLVSDGYTSEKYIITDGFGNHSIFDKTSRKKPDDGE